MSRALGVALALLLLLAAPAPLRAGGLEQDDFFRHPGEEMERTEFWTAVLRSESGWTLYLSYLVTNLGMGSGNTGYAVSLTSPEGEVYQTKARYPDTEFSEDRDVGLVKVGPQRLRMQPPDFDLVIDDPKAEVGVDLHMKTWAEGYEFGDGRLTVSEAEGHYLEYFFLVPRADVTGSLTVQGKRVDFVGDGYLEHLVTNRAITKWSRRWYVLNGFAGDLTVHMMLGYPSEGRSDLHGKLGFLAVTDRSGVLFATRHPKLTFRTPKKDVEGCAWPEELKIEARTKRGSARVHYRVTKLHDAYVALAQLAWPIRKFVESIVGNPIFLRFHNSFELTLETGGKTRTAKGTGLHQVICL